MIQNSWQAFALAFCVAVPVSAAPPVPVQTAPKPAPTAKQPAKSATRLDIFNIVWRTVRDGHYDPKMNGVNWNAVRVRYLPQVAAARDEQQFYAVLNKMLGELKESHLGAIPPSALGVAKEIAPGATATAGSPGNTGITAEWIDDKPVVVRVAEKSAGAEAGVKPGFIITAVNNKAVAPIIAQMLKAQPTADPRAVVWMMMETALNGVLGKPYPLTITDATGAEKTLTVTPRQPAGQMVTFAALPPIPADIETKTLAGNIGYIRFSIFLMPLLQPVKDAVRDFAAKDVPAIIFDLRGNRGGIGVMANAIAGTLTDKEFSIGTMKTRASTMKFLAYPQAPRYNGKVVILADEGSISTSEIMAAGLQEAGRATIIGRRTAGMVLPSQVVTLPDGGRLQFVFGDFRTPKGVFLEGRGVLPDVAVPVTPASLTASPSGDPILDAALDFLKNTKTPFAKETAK